MAVHYKAFDFADGLIVYRRNLPHWRQTGCAYFVTFRLADSIPQRLLKQWDMVRNGWLKHHPQPWTEDEMQEYNRMFTSKMEEYMHNGYGSCMLKDKRLSSLVEKALLHFNEVQYDIGDYVVMSNHVHVIMVPRKSFTVESVVGAWKGFTSKKINQETGRSGQLWSEGFYDHIVRHENELKRIARYIKDNPVKAGRLASSAIVGGNSDSWVCDLPRYKRQFYGRGRP